MVRDEQLQGSMNPGWDYYISIDDMTYIVACWWDLLWNKFDILQLTKRKTYNEIGRSVGEKKNRELWEQKNWQLYTAVEKFGPCWIYYQGECSILNWNFLTRTALLLLDFQLLMRSNTFYWGSLMRFIKEIEYQLAEYKLGLLQNIVASCWNFCKWCWNSRLQMYHEE